MLVMAVSSVNCTPSPPLFRHDSDSSNTQQSTAPLLHRSWGQAGKFSASGGHPVLEPFHPSVSSCAFPRFSFSWPLHSNFLFPLNACVMHRGCFLLLVPARKPRALLLSHHLPKQLCAADPHKGLEVITSQHCTAAMVISE